MLNTSDRGEVNTKVGASMRASDNDAFLRRIRAEYVEMPGMSLTLAQVAWLCGIERSLCGPVLDTLVEAGFLCRKTNGTYSRATDDVRVARAGADREPYHELP
jgi:hypothetical protein